MKPRDADAAFTGLEIELMAEAAQSLGLAGKKLEATLAALAACPPDARPSARHVLLDAAVDATFAYVVQRESMGWRDSAAALDLYGVPFEVRARLGATRGRQ